MHNGCDMSEGSLRFVCILTVGAVIPGAGEREGKEGGEMRIMIRSRMR